MLKPFVLYDGVRVQTKWLDGTEDDSCTVLVNKSGFMDCKLFCSYVEQVVVPYLESLSGEMKSTRALLTLDGHYSHIYSEDPVEFWRAKDMEVLCLPAGQTSKLQPLDVSVFGPLKKSWRRYLKSINGVADQVILQVILLNYSRY